ncbi:phosphoglycerate mutase family protein [Byssothecium circinans]|uniref:Phosphoglycerate mutase family protein n=1 Tax=Byssothecium circinans TaxID=147558 RepID=A0A6A5TE24_9PLEO|nr:phosphoglycerate mutase family protein [Byssothecium circinans]KAF1950861.1 phosphoglycerate mutase family protein [Byssothecium circinans]
MIEVIYIIRHAFRANWVVNAQTGEYTASTRTPTGIPTDPPLAAKGVEQSKELAAHLCQLDPPIERVYSSPFYRCLQTLKPTTERLFREGKAGGKIKIDRGIGEFFGRASFTHPEPPTLALLAAHFTNLDQDYQSLHIPAPKGELIVELHERVNRAITRIINDLDNDPEQPKTVLICTHAATMIALGRVLTGNMPEDPDEDDFQCYTASLSKFVRKSDDAQKGVVGNWECELNSETNYLSGGAERGWKFNGEESFIAFPDAQLDDKESAKL